MKHCFPHVFFNCVCILMLLSCKLYGQHFSTKLYNVNDGLPSTEIHQTYQDKYGYLWISTPAGLSRFDGRQFENYSLTDGLPSLQATAFFQDSQNRLWAGTGAGMAQFKNNRFMTYPVSDGNANLYVFNFFETKQQQVWALTDYGVYAFEDTAWKKTILFPGYENTRCRSLVELDGELYALFYNSVFYKSRHGKWIEILLQQADDMYNILSVYQNKIWLSTQNHLFELHNQQLIPACTQHHIKTDFFSFLVDSKDRLWLAETNYIRISFPGDYNHFSDSIINPYGRIFSLKEDADNNIWLTTRSGLLKLKEIDYAVIDKNNKVPLDGIFNIIPLPGNKILLSSGTKTGLTLYDHSSFKQLLPPQLPRNDFYFRDPVDAYTFDDNNNLWMTTRLWRLLFFDGKMLKDYSTSIHRKTTAINYDLAYVKSRKQLFICGDSTLLYGTPSHLTAFIPRNTGVPVIMPTRIHELKNGLLLLFIAGRGFYCIDKADNLMLLSNKTDYINSGYNLQSTARFLEEKDNNFWMAVPGLGLYEYSFANNKLPYLIKPFTGKEGLQSTNILGLTSDMQNRLWIVSMTGIDILQKNNAGEWQVFNYANTDELSLNGSYYQKLATDADGNVWLSSPNKILKFNTSAIHFHKETPHIIIEKVLLAFKETNWGKLADSLYSYYQLPYNPVLRYNQNSLGISFNAIDLSTSNATPEFSYKLLPLNTSWSIPSKTKSVSFAQLPAGKYQFMVRAKDMASGWCQPAVFIFIIAPPFWDEWWFRLLIIVINALIITGVFRVRIKKIRQNAFVQNQLKELEIKALKVQMNPHFIYNALNSIQALVANDKKREGIHYIGSFSRLLRQVLDNSENNVISLDKELETIDLYIQLEALRLDFQLQYTKDIPADIVTEFEKVPPLILQPFIENALWHGLSRKEGEKEIKIAISLMNDWLLCDITDNGIGRLKAQEIKSHSLNLHQSKGIDITRKRLIDFNEDFLISPIAFFDLYDTQNNACGTQVTIRIKRKSA